MDLTNRVRRGHVCAACPLNMLVCRLANPRESDFASSIKNGQDPECGHKTVMFLGRRIYVLAPLHLAAPGKFEAERFASTAQE
jgi:hypothetical protein